MKQFKHLNAPIVLPLAMDSDVVSSLKIVLLPSTKSSALHGSNPAPRCQAILGSKVELIP